MLSLRGTQQTIIGPHSSLEIDVNTTLAFIMGEVPRLIVREGSDAWEIQEGQSLRVNGPKAQLINPFARSAQFVLGFGYEEQVQTPESWITARHMEKLRNVIVHDTPAAVVDRRTGLFIQAKRSNYQLELLAEGSFGTRVQLISNAPANMVAAKGAAVFNSTATMVDMYNRPNADIVCAAGTVTDAEITAWLAAAGHTGEVRSVSHNTSSSSVLRWIVRPDTAVIITRDVNTAFTVRPCLMDRGLETSEFN